MMIMTSQGNDAEWLRRMAYNLHAPRTAEDCSRLLRIADRLTPSPVGNDALIYRARDLAAEIIMILATLQSKDGEAG